MALYPFNKSNSLHSPIEMVDPIKEKKDAQRGWVSCPSTHSCQEAKLAFQSSYT